MESLILGAISLHILGFWLLLLYVFRLRKRLRCLGFCYIKIGDWGIDRLNDAKEYYIHVHGEHLTPFILMEASDQFQKQLAVHREYFKEVGLSPPSERELNYPLEGL